MDEFVLFGLAEIIDSISSTPDDSDSEETSESFSEYFGKFLLLFSITQMNDGHTQNDII